MKKWMHPVLWGVILLLLVFLSSAQNKYHTLSDQIEQMKASGLQEQPQLDYVNALRAKHGVAPLKYDDGLIKAADARVDDMLKRHYWSHETPDGTPFYVTIVKLRPGLRYMGENIGQCFHDYKELYRAYEESPSHLEAIINPNFRVFGGSTQWDDTKNCFVNSNEFGGN